MTRKKFVQEKAKKRLRLKNHWRKPKGSQNKVRRSEAGHKVKVKIGFGGSKKNKTPISVIKNLNDLEKAKGEIIIASTVGGKKRTELLKKIKEKKLIVKNIKNIDDYLKKIEEKLKQNKEKKTANKKKEEKKTANKKKEEKEKTKEEEKKELDKILTKK